MPKKGAKKTNNNKQLSITLPDGARLLLDQLVALKVVGDSHSGVIAFLVQSQLQAMARDYGLKLPADAANSPSTGAKPDGSPQR
jgi:hypothetical protein